VQKALVPVAGAAAGAGAVFLSARELHAEEPSTGSYVCTPSPKYTGTCTATHAGLVEP
jgi:hypothetical protein